LENKNKNKIFISRSSDCSIVKEQSTYHTKVESLSLAAAMVTGREEVAEKHNLLATEVIEIRR
jgi:hypothetical protein